MLPLSTWHGTVTSRCDLLVQGNKSAGVQVCVFYQPHSEAESGPLLFAVQETTGRQNSRVHVFLGRSLCPWADHLDWCSYGRKQRRFGVTGWEYRRSPIRAPWHCSPYTKPVMVNAIHGLLAIVLFHPEGNACPLSLSINRVEDVSSHWPKQPTEREPSLKPWFV